MERQEAAPRASVPDVRLPGVRGGARAQKAVKPLRREQNRAVRETRAEGVPDA